MDDNFGLFFAVGRFQNPKGSILITQKGLVANVLDSSLDLSSYASV